ncbi:MAG: FAD-dependent oxidoreductase [Actinobacteria bacterium]|nr:FAD-dependent oxidoreductase [Actinomycetota bacterium]
MKDDALNRVKYDALVIGSGISGMESALKLGDMGYKVLVVEKEASVGGKMILLSKVFPTLDCASCISTPKMGATIHHPNLTVLTYAEVETIERQDGGFRARIKQKPRFVVETACTGCRQCEMVCKVAVPDEFNADLVSRRAAHIAFPQAVPKKAVIERQGTSRCTFNCPAGIKAHGYVALVRSGEYEKAFQLVADATPLVGSLGRACYAPCESECSRGNLEGPLSIRRLKRFVADMHYAKPRVAPETPPANGMKVAVVGSGPAGLTAAWHLARKGYEVKIFEAAPQPGGMMRLALPPYRLPIEVVEQDIANVTDIGVTIQTNSRIEDLEALKAQGFSAVLVAIGTHLGAKLRVPGEDLQGIVRATEFLRAAKLGERLEVAGKRVVVIGGGNVAIDAARTAMRLHAGSVEVLSLESLKEMPAHPWEIAEAKAEGVTFRHSCGVRDFEGDERVRSINLLRCISVLDEKGRFNPKYSDKRAGTVEGDLVVVAAGMRPDSGEFGLPINPSGTFQVDKGTLQTCIPDVFAAGDAVAGPTMITSAAGEGRRAAFMIDRWLHGQAMDVEEFERRLEMVDKEAVLARQSTYRELPAGAPREAVKLAPGEFYPDEETMTEVEALDAAARCLDCGVCSECNSCVDICPAHAIDLKMQEQEIEAEVGTVLLATGYTLFPADLKPQYGYGKFKNVITGMQMDRLLAPTRPYNAVVRPGDGKVPDSIAFILCTGSRDETLGNPMCSRICCMYSIKHNQLIMGALPLADVTVYYMDVRTPSKGYNEFYEQAKGMGANFVKGRVASISEKDNGNLLLRYEDIENGTVTETEHDMVVLAVGVRPNDEAARLFPGNDLRLDEFGWVGESNEDVNPGATNISGVFVAGAASGVKDIPDSILHAGGAAAQAAAYLERHGRPATDAAALAEKLAAEPANGGAPAASTTETGPASATGSSTAKAAGVAR